jgi:hypothetical protein
MNAALTPFAESPRLEALIRHHVGWQVDDLHVILNDRRLVLEGHAKCAFARRLAQEEAARLTGLPVENRMAVD